MKKFRLAMVAACPFPANRGTPSRILRMAQGLANRNHDVTVVTYHFGLPLPVFNIKISRTPRVPYYNYSPGPTLAKLLLLDPLLFFRLLQVVLTKKIDLIHAHHFEGALVAYAVRKLTGVKVLYDSHTTLEGELPYYKFFYHQSLAAYLDKKVPQWADHVIVVSNSLKDFLMRIGVDKNKIDVVPTGVNLEIFEGGRPDLVRKRYQLYGKKVVMYTGSLTSYQGIEYLLEAMSKVFQHYEDVTLLLVGKLHSAEYQKRCIDLGIDNRVIFTGEQSLAEIPHFLSAADVIVSPRIICPGIPQKLTNYMATQKGIVCFDGSAKFLTHNQDALVVENGNCNAMANAIGKLLENRSLRTYLGKNARKALKNCYDWDTLCRQVEDIYCRVINSASQL